jgi:4-amino-4-deoxy-L-arabinose transferase-like glycosyltransferase
MSRADPRLLAALFVCVAVRLALFSTALPDTNRFFTLDAEGYMALAREPVLGYGRPGTQLFELGLVRTPGYPLWASAVLGVAGGRVAAVVLAQIAVSAGCVWLTFLLGRTLLGAAAAGVAALLLAADPASALYACLLQPETLFTAVLLAAALSWVLALRHRSWRLAACCGTLLGFATLTRPIGLYLPAAFAAVALVGRARVPRGAAPSGALLRPLAALMLPYLLVVGGWIARNRAVTGVAVLSTIEGVNLLDYRAAGAMAASLGIPIEEARNRLRARLESTFPRAQNASERSRNQSALALAVLREHPGGALRSAATGVVKMLSGTGLTVLKKLRGEREPERMQGTADAITSLALGIVWGCVALAALAGSVDLGRRGASDALLLPLVLIACFSALSAGPEANTRFRVPFAPFVCLLAGHACSRPRQPLFGARAQA